MRVALLLLLAVAAACGGGSEQTSTSTQPPTPPKPAAPPPPSPDEARTLIANSPEFSEFQFTHAAYTLPMQHPAMHDEARKVARDLRRAGWISIDGAGTVVLSPKARDDKRFLVRQNGVVDIVPLARKELVAVDAVTPGADAAPQVDFRWHWIPNEIGRLFGDRYAGEQRARATLIWDGTRWSVLRVAPGTP